MEKSKFDHQTMYKIGSGDCRFCTFDFSIIPSEQYVKFFNSLPSFLYKRVEGVSFTCNLFALHKKSEKVSERKERIIADSISSKNPKFIPFLLKILKRVLNKSKELKSIELSSMEMGNGMLAVFFNIIASCKSIEKISMKNISVPHELFLHFLEKTSPYHFVELSFVECGLTSHCFKDIKAFLRKPPMEAKMDRKLLKFCVSGNSLTEREEREIDDLVEMSKHQDLTNGDGDGEPDFTIIEEITKTNDIVVPSPTPRQQLLLSTRRKSWMGSPSTTKSPNKSENNDKISLRSSNTDNESHASPKSKNISYGEQKNVVNSQVKPKEDNNTPKSNKDTPPLLNEINQVRPLESSDDEESYYNNSYYEEESYYQ